MVEDHAPTIDLLVEVLGQDGHVVTAERDGIAGRQRALSEPFDLILSDIGLPGLDGLGLARAVRAAGLTTPLVALTGRSSEDERMVGVTAGFDGYLTKPISATALLREIAIREAGRRPNMVAPDRGEAAAAAWAPTPPTTSVAASAVAPPAPAATGRVGRRRGVLGGLVVIAMGLPFMLQPLGVPNAAAYLFPAMGAAFLISYLRGRQYVYLIPMVTLTSFGIALLLPSWIAMRPDAVGPAFVAIVALGFLTAFVLAPSRRWPLVPAAVLGAMASLRLVTGSSPIPTALEPFLVPVVLVIVGIYLLVERQD